MRFSNKNAKSFPIRLNIIIKNQYRLIQIYAPFYHQMKKYTFKSPILASFCGPSVFIGEKKLIFSVGMPYFGSREESKVSGFFVFSHLRMMGYFRLG